MNNTNYRICQNDIYVGQLVQATRVYKYKDDNGSMELDAEKYQFLRTILFTPNHDLSANDLLYDSPYYPVLNMTSDLTCMNIQYGSIIVRKYIPLKSYLSSYPEELSYEDIKKIKTELVKGKLIRNNKKINLKKLWQYYDNEEGMNNRMSNKFKPSKIENVKKLAK